MRGRLYLRKSRALGDADDPQLLAHQRQALLRLAAVKGIVVDPSDVVEEVGSGDRIETRPRFAALLAEYESGRITGPEALLVTEMERLTRGSLADVGRVLDALVAARVRLVTLSREYDLTDPDDELWYGLTAGFGRRELGKFKQRVQLRFDQLLRDGRHRNGCVPYGYRWDYEHKRPVPHPDEFPVLQSWCRRILNESTRRIAADHGVRGNRVRAIMRNPMICGYPVRRFAPDNPLSPQSGYHLLPQADWIWPEKPGEYPAACTRAEWEEIQKVLDRRMASRSATWATDGWSRSVLRFHAEPTLGDPISGYVRLSQRYGTKPVYRFYLAEGGELEIARVVVHEIATEALAQLFADPDRLAAAWANAQQPAQNDDRTSAIQADLLAQRTLLDRIALAEVAANDPEHQASLTRNREAIQVEIKRLQRELHAVRTPPPVTLPVEKIQDMAGHFADIWAITPDSERRHLVEGCLTAIHFHVKHRPGRHQSLRLCLGWDYQPWIDMPPVRCEYVC